MTKTQLIDAISENSGISSENSGKFLDSLTSTISEALQAGDKVALLGFGTFSITERAAREGRNPHTGEKLQIAAKKVVKFKAGSNLSESIQ